ncbi:MAG: SH3 domain-containing protein [Candidatus Omnitrophica bacterium]|nr:SH3 domain-containing protein [Candidatus Omnitrophota bacterium]
MRLFLIALSFIIFFNSNLQAQEDLFPFVGQISSNSVNIRAGLNKNFEQLCQLSQGEEVLVVEKSYGWYKIKLPLVAKSYISNEFVLTNNNIDGEVVSERVNVRAGPGINHTVLGQINSGYRIQILEVIGDWYRIKPIDESFGWVSEELVSFKSRDIESFQWKHLVQDVPPRPVQIDEVAVKAAKSTLEDKIKEPLVEETKTEDHVDQVRKKSEEVKKSEAVAVVESIVVEAQKDVILEGKLIQSTEKGLPDVAFILILDDQSMYFVKGLKRLLHNYLGYKIRVKGDVSPETISSFNNPLIDIQEFQLML